MFSFVPRCHGLRGSAKKTLTPYSMVNRAWSDSSLPRSHVNDCQSSAGSVVTVLLSALANFVGTFLIKDVALLGISLVVLAEGQTRALQSDVE